MENLNDLHLENSAITLTPDTALRLAGMEHLQYIDLDDNPLNITPDFSNMANLNTLYMSNTELTAFPDSLLWLTRLEVVDLSENLIVELPASLFEPPPSVTQALDLEGNPLSEESLERVRTYFAQTGIDMNVEFEVDDANAPKPAEE